jgi:hypothetical protein
VRTIPKLHLDLIEVEESILNTKLPHAVRIKVNLQDVLPQGCKLSASVLLQTV